MLASLDRSKANNLECILDSKLTEATSKELWNQLHCYQFLDEMNKFFALSLTCRHKDCKSHIP